MTEEPRKRPNRSMQLILRTPALMYRLGLADRLAERHVMLLETIGWRSGRRRQSALNFAMAGDTVYIAAGWGPRTSWYRNLLANPKVRLQIGGKRWQAQARPVTDSMEAAKAAALMEQIDGGPPKRLRPLLRKIGFDFDAERAQAFKEPEKLTFAALELAEPLAIESAHGRTIPIMLLALLSVVGLGVLKILTRRRR